MGIDAQLREHDEILAEVGDPQMVLSRAARSSAFAQTRLLKYLEPWGDAMFNQTQANDLAADIAAVTRANADPQLVQLLSRLEPLIARLSSQAHTNLWFVGD
jgi:glutathione synthase/RimK-type ligase-like ATP-grasp enzyme